MGKFSYSYNRRIRFRWFSWFREGLLRNWCSWSWSNNSSNNKGSKGVVLWMEGKRKVMIEINNNKLIVLLNLILRALFEFYL